MVRSHALTRRSPAAEAQTIDDAIEATNHGAFARVDALLSPVAPSSMSPTLHVLLAEARFALGHLDEAIARLQDVVDRVAPGHHDAAAVLAHLLIIRGEREAASIIVDRLIQVPARRDEHVFSLVPPLSLLGRDQELAHGDGGNDSGERCGAVSVSKKATTAVRSRGSRA